MRQKGRRSPTWRLRQPLPSRRSGGPLARAPDRCRRVDPQNRALGDSRAGVVAHGWGWLLVLSGPTGSTGAATMIPSAASVTSQHSRRDHTMRDLQHDKPFLMRLSHRLAFADAHLHAPCREVPRTGRAQGLLAKRDSSQKTARRAVSGRCRLYLPQPAERRTIPR